MNPDDHFDDTLEPLAQALAAGRARVEDLMRSGLARHQAGDLAGAIADYSAALTLDPCLVEALNNRAIAHHARGEFARAISDFDAALRIYPAYAQAYCNRGATRQVRGDHAGALADHDQAMQLLPESAQVYKSRAAVRAAQGDLEGALADINEAIRLAPEDVEAYERRGGIHARRRDHAAAGADFDRALERCQHGGVPMGLFCSLLIQRGDASDGIGDESGLREDYRRAFRLDAALAARIVVERLADTVRSNLPGLLAECADRLRAQPGDYVAHRRRGLAWVLCGRDTDARRDFEQVRRKEPDPDGLQELLETAARKYRDAHGSIATNAPSPAPGAPLP